jgi:hypothetical protein
MLFDGERIGDVLIERFFAMGGICGLFYARNDILGIECVVKVLCPRYAPLTAANAGQRPPPSPPLRAGLSARDLQCMLVLSHDEYGFACVRWRHVAGLTEDLPSVIDDFATRTLVRSDDDKSDLMPGLCGTYAHILAETGGDSSEIAREYRRDFEHAWAPEENQC